MPERLLTRRDRIDAYFLENTFPGDEKGAIKPAGRLITSEGALSAFFHRWATNDALKQRDRDAAFYDLFGTTAVEVTPLQNVYLKLFHAMERRRSNECATWGPRRRDAAGPAAETAAVRSTISDRRRLEST